MYEIEFTATVCDRTHLLSFQRPVKIPTMGRLFGFILTDENSTFVL